MGGANSAIDNNTKNVLLFVQNYNPVNIRKTSMNLAVRTEAAHLFEKGICPELAGLGMRRGIDLFVELTHGIPEKEILDIYPKPRKKKKIKIDYEFINKKIGIEISKKEVDQILVSLGFVNGFVPSWRNKDIEIAEDITEEVARIYGYHNIPSTLMAGKIPSEPINKQFAFELRLKQNLKGFGGTEVYTLSLVSKSETSENSLRVKNPLGEDSAYLRTTLKPSLVKALEENIGEKETFHLFEMANVYLPKKGDLPEERMTLAGIFFMENYRKAKGIIEAVLDGINIEYTGEEQDNALVYKSGKTELGKVEVTNENYIYYEFEVAKLFKLSRENKKYIPIPKFPPQIEDLTFVLGERTKVGEIIASILNLKLMVTRIELVDIFNDAYTFRLWYQNESKTLNDKEVESIRNRIVKEVKDKFGGIIKN